MLYLQIIIVNVLGIFFQYKIKAFIIFAFRFTLRALMWHPTKMKHNTIHTIHILYLTQSTSQNIYLNTVNANFK